MRHYNKDKEVFGAEPRKEDVINLSTKSLPPTSLKKKALDLEAIATWAKAYHMRNGKWPAQDSGPVLVESSQDTGETWKAIDWAFRDGGRGLKGCGYTSLADFLNKHFERDLCLEQIAKSATAHYERTGSWPTVRTGRVLDESGRETDETWSGIDCAFRDGGRGLKGCGYTSLADFLDKHFGRDLKEDLSLKQIATWAKAHYETTGKWPTQNSGPVLEETGQDTGETWTGINGAFKNGGRGLKGCGYTSLADFLNKHFEREIKEDLSLDQIASWAKAHYQRTGKWPTGKRTPVLDEIGQDIGETWRRIDLAFRNGHRGLKDCGYTSLAAFLDASFRNQRPTRDTLPPPDPDVSALLDLIP